MTDSVACESPIFTTFPHSPAPKTNGSAWLSRSRNLVIWLVQDGQICEAVTWEKVGAGQRHRILDHIVQYILEKHMPGSSVTGYAGLFDWAVARHGVSADELLDARRCALFESLGSQTVHSFQKSLVSSNV